MYKSLSDRDVLTSPYTARKRWRLTNDSSYLTFHIGSNSEEPFDSSDSPKNASGTYTRAVYEIIRHKYYRRNGTAFQRFGIGDRSEIDLSTFPREDDAIVYVLKISSRFFGKRIRPGTFKIRNIAQENPITAKDDEYGNLISEKTNEQIGNVFYQNGVAVLTKPPEVVFDLNEEDFPDDFPFSDAQNLYTAYPDYEKNSFDLLFQQFELEFDSTVQNFENQISAKIDPDQFGAMTNPTAREDERTAIEPLQDGDFQPYVTSIGFYNDDGELTAVGKLSRPVKLPESTPMTILGRFDT